MPAAARQRSDRRSEGCRHLAYEERGLSRGCCLSQREKSHCLGDAVVSYFATAQKSSQSFNPLAVFLSGKCPSYVFMARFFDNLSTMILDKM